MHRLPVGLLRKHQVERDVERERRAALSVCALLCCEVDVYVLGSIAGYLPMVVQHRMELTIAELVSGCAILL